MIEEKIDVINGKYVNSENIVEKDNLWQFINYDPQMYIKFDTPVIGLSLDILLNKMLDKTLHIVIYFRTCDEIFSEVNKYEFDSKVSNKAKIMLHFNKKIDEIRIDLTDENIEIDVAKIVIEGIVEKKDNYIYENFTQYSDGEKILILSHDLTNTGAPILAFNIAKELKKLGKQVVVLVGNSNSPDLAEKYNKAEIPIIYLDSEKNNFAVEGYVSRDEITHIRILLEAARDLGYEKIITNTVVAGEYVRLLKDMNFKIVSLIHEMKTTIEIYNFKKFGNDIALYSDYIVFPDEIVATGFRELYIDIVGKVVIRPQGIYFKNDEIIANEKKSEYDFLLNKKFVMGSGSAELRKGIDLFISAAAILNSFDKDIYFIWTGNFGGNKELEGWIRNQINSTALKDRMYIIPFIKDPVLYKKLLLNASAFWLTSREDPFPSVALEAMSLEVPVLAFKNSGGVNTMLADNRGILIDNFNVCDLSNETIQIINNKINNRDISDFCEKLNFSEYIGYLLELLNEKKLVEPYLDIYKWCNVRRQYEGQLLTDNLTPEQRIEKLNIAIKENRKWFKHKESIEKIQLVCMATDYRDSMIVQNYKEIFNTVFSNKKLSNTLESIKGNHLKILCGTQILNKYMENLSVFIYPQNFINLKNTCLLGGSLQIDESGIEFSDYSKKLLNLMLNNKYIHSVRDEYTKLELEKIGITNVINTGSPSMWRLTPEFCKTIPENKGKNVLTTIKNPNDQGSLMLEILKKNYEDVYIWVQNYKEYEALREIIELRDYKIIPPDLLELEKICKQTDLDYIGTNLEIGIVCLNNRHRSLIIPIDNQTYQLADQTMLKVMNRSKIGMELDAWINSCVETKIIIPQTEIKIWINQFK